MFYRHITEQLKAWKASQHGKPLVLRGARQTGKSTVIREFGNHHYKHFVEVNFEKLRDYQRFGNIQDLHTLEVSLTTFFHNPAIDENTLIFLDEIQEAPELIKLLRFIKEERPHWHVIAAGSLLEPVLAKAGMEFPVGRVTFLDLYPLTFLEFLKAQGEDNLVDYAYKLDLTDNLPANFREVYQQYFYQYLLTGGMPEAVKVWQTNQDVSQLQQLYDDLFQAFREDLYKYTGNGQAKYLDQVLMTVPQLAGSNAAYKEVGQNTYNTREIHHAADTLEQLRLLHKIPQTNAKAVPLQGHSQRKHKWLFLDLGFCVHQQFHSLTYILSPEKWGEQFRGQIMEQVTGQTLIGGKIAHRNQLFYWAKPRHKGEAELDFCYPFNDKVVGIEVKSSAKQPARSLLSFQDEVTKGIAIQSDLYQWGYQRASFNGKNYRIAYIPIYLLELLNHYLSGE